MKWRNFVSILLAAVAILAVFVVPAMADGPTVLVVADEPTVANNSKVEASEWVTPCDNPTVWMPPVFVFGNAPGFPEGTEVKAEVTVELSPGVTLSTSREITSTVRSWTGWDKGVYYENVTFIDIALPWDCPETGVLEGVMKGVRNIIVIKVDGITVGTGESMGIDGSVVMIDIKPAPKGVVKFLRELLKTPKSAIVPIPPRASQ